jgi:hypothetical protein
MKSLLVAGIVLGCAIPAFSGPVNLSTGIATYSVLEQSGPAIGDTGTAQVVTSSDADWYGGWVADSSSSDWIAFDPFNCCDNGLGTYSTTFSLNAGDISTAAISGSWTLDDSGSLYLNGNLVGSLSDGNWGSLTAFSVAAGSSDFVLGTNTLSLEITDTDQVLEGVNLQGSLTGVTTATPEPSMFILLAAGLGILIGFARLRKALYN